MLKFKELFNTEEKISKLTGIFSSSEKIDKAIELLETSESRERIISSLLRGKTLEEYMNSGSNSDQSIPIKEMFLIIDDLDLNDSEKLSMAMYIGLNYENIIKQSILYEATKDKPGLTKIIDGIKELVESSKNNNDEERIPDEDNPKLKKIEKMLMKYFTKHDRP